MKEFLNPNGRATRSQYWSLVACFFVFCVILGGIQEATGVAQEGAEPPEWFKVTVGLFMLPFIVISIIVQIKRWHDLDKSGWWIFINLIICFGGLFSVIMCGFIKGTTGANRFGPDPLATPPPPLPRA